MTPTAEMVSRPDSPAPRPQPLLDRLGALSGEIHALPAEPLAEVLLGTHLAANVMLLGFAWQRGAIPIRADHIEAAIGDCGVAVEANRRAFTLGRRLAAEPEAVARVLAAVRPKAVGEDGSPERAGRLFGEAWQALHDLVAAVDERDASLDPVHDVRPLLSVRLAGWAEDLADYHDVDYARRFLGAIHSLARCELASGSGSRLVATPVAARELYRLMAYKDEYEVARLHVRGPWRRWLDARAKGRARVTFRLHPPLLRAMGLARKLELGPWFEPVLRALAACRRLRGTRFDPFGRTAARRLDRALVAWYLGVLERIESAIDAGLVEEAVGIAGMAGEIRGYEDIRARAADRVMARVEEAFADLDDKADEGPA